MRWSLVAGASWMLSLADLTRGSYSNRPLIILVALLLAACNAFTDPATRLAYDIEAGARKLAPAEGSTYIVHHTPAHANECSGPYRVQLDKAGALIVWCKSASGDTLASGSTSYHARFIDTPQTFVVDKPAGSTLSVEIVRRQGRAVVSNVY